MDGLYKYYLTYNSVRTQLDIDPIGWDESGIIWERSDLYYSVLRSYSLTLKFVITNQDVEEGGGQIIIDAYDTEDIKAVIDIEIEKYNPQTDAYDAFYSGILELKSNRFKIDYEEKTVECGIIDGSKENKFVTRDEIEYNLYATKTTNDSPVDNLSNMPADVTFKPIDFYLYNESITVYSRAAIDNSEDNDQSYYSSIAGNITLKESGDNFTMDGVPDDISLPTGFIPTYENTGLLPTRFRIDKLKINYETFINCEITNTDNYAAFLSIFYIMVDNLYEDNVFYLFDRHVKAFVDISEDETYTESGTIDYDSTGSYIITDENNLLTPDPPTTGYRVNHLIKPGGKVYIGCAILSNSPGIHKNINWQAACYIRPDISFITETNFTEIEIGADENTVECFLPHEAFSRLVQLMTDEQSKINLFYSNFFGRIDSKFHVYGSNGDGSLDVITSGTNLRQFENKRIKVSFKELFKHFNSVYNLGCGYDRLNDRFYIEQKSEFFKNGLLFDLGEVKGLRQTPYDKYFTEIKSGYPKVEYDKKQGTKEFNTETKHIVDSVVDGTLDIQSPLNGDSVGIELQRRFGITKQASEDTKNDNNIYVVRTNGTETVQGGTNVTCEDIENIDEYYNIDLLPRENVLRWQNYINSFQWREASKLIKYVSSQKEINLEYDNQNGDTVTELSDIVNAELTQTRLFNAVIYEFETDIDTSIIQTLNYDPHGVVQFSYDGIDKFGFILKLQTKDYNKTANVTLLGVDFTPTNRMIFEDGVNFVFDDSVYPVVNYKNYED